MGGTTSFSKKMQQLRVSAGLTQFELANVLKVSQQSISKYENGVREPDVHYICQFSKFFNVSIDYLLLDDFQTVDGKSCILNNDESDLVNAYRILSAEDKHKALEIIRTLLRCSISDQTLPESDQ